MVLDQGSRSGALLPGVPTLVIDHHQPEGFPEGATVSAGFACVMFTDTDTDTDTDTMQAKQRRVPVVRFAANRSSLHVLQMVWYAARDSLLQST
jgi:hypothetical protein